MYYQKTLWSFGACFDMNSKYSRTGEFPLWFSGNVWLGSIRTRVWSLAPLSGLRIYCCHELCCRSRVATSILQCCGCGVDRQLQLHLDPYLATSIWQTYGPKEQIKKKKKKRKRKKRKKRWQRDRTTQLRNLELGHRQSFMSRSLHRIKPKAKLSKTWKHQLLLSGLCVKDWILICYHI